MTDRIELSCDGLGSGALFVAFRGEEALSQPFVYDVYASVPLDAVPAHADVVATPATFAVEGNEEGASPMHTNGIVSKYEVVHEAAERAIVRLEVRPKLWLLDLSRHSRIFTKKKVPDILAEVLDAGGVEHELRLDGSYPEEEHVTQYKESDLAFVSRLMEHEGIYYFFEHSDGAHKLILTDSKLRHELSRSTAVAYHPVEDGDLGSDLFDVFTERRRVLPKTVRMTDYDYGNPSLAVKGEGHPGGAGAEVVVHGARAFSPGQVEQLAKVRTEEVAAQAKVFDGRGTAFHLRAGGQFEVADHPRSDVNAKYLCVALQHEANARARGPELARLLGFDPQLVYRARVRAISADVQYRPERVTPRPRVPGFERGVVDGPADSDYAQLDADGRYRVKLGFDESDNEGDKSSVRTRMMQPHAGNPEGWHLPLRKDTEVFVAYVNGDPDRPVIAGAVPNAVTPSVVTSSNHTKNIFHTGGDNVVEIEDDDGKQWIDVRCPTEDSFLHLGKPATPTHHVVAHTAADCWFKIGGDQDIVVGAKLTEDVTDTVTETYNTSQTSDVTGPQETTVMGSVTENYKTGHKTTVSGNTSEVYISGQTTNVTGGDRFELYDSSQKTLVVGGANHTYDLQDSTVSGPSTQIYAGPKTLIVGGATEFTFDAAVTQMFGPTTTIVASTDWTWDGGAGIVTPSWKSTYVGCSQIRSSVSRTGGVTWTISSTFDLIALKYEACVASAAAVGLKVEGAIFVAEAYGAKFALTGIFLSTSATKVHKASIKKWGTA